MGEEVVSDDWKGWGPLVHRTEDGATLETTSNKNSSLRFTLPSIENEVGFMVSMRARATGVVPGVKNWHCPRAVFCYYDENDKGIYGTPHAVFTTEKERWWKTHRAFFPVPERGVRARFHLQNFGLAGVLDVEHVSIVPAKPRASFPYWKALFAFLWFSALGICVVALRLWRQRFGWIICGLIFAIIIGVLLPKDALNYAIQTSCKPQKIISNLRKTPPVPPSGEKPEVKSKPRSRSKKELIEYSHGAGHVTLFGLLSLFATLSWLQKSGIRKRSVAIFSGLILFAAATEVLQNVTPDRRAGWSDLSLDIIGIVVAFVVALVFRPSYKTPVL